MDFFNEDIKEGHLVIFIEPKVPSTEALLATSVGIVENKLTEGMFEVRIIDGSKKSLHHFQLFPICMIPDSDREGSLRVIIRDAHPLIINEFAAIVIYFLKLQQGLAFIFLELNPAVAKLEDLAEEAKRLKERYGI